MTCFNQVAIKIQLILDIAFCDYEEEKKKKKKKNIRNRIFTASRRKFLKVDTVSRTNLHDSLIFPLWMHTLARAICTGDANNSNKIALKTHYSGQNIAVLS